MFQTTEIFAIWTGLLIVCSEGTREKDVRCTKMSSCDQRSLYDSLIYQACRDTNECSYVYLILSSRMPPAPDHGPLIPCRTHFVDITRSSSSSNWAATNLGLSFWIKWPEPGAITTPWLLSLSVKPSNPSLYSFQPLSLKSFSHTFSNMARVPTDSRTV